MPSSAATMQHPGRHVRSTRHDMRIGRPGARGLFGCNTRAWRPYRRFRREAAPSSEGFDWPALMRYGAEFRACDVRDMSVHPGLRGRAVRRQDVHSRGRPTGGAVPDRQPRGEAFTVTRRQPFQPITSCQHFPGGHALRDRRPMAATARPRRRRVPRGQQHPGTERTADHRDPPPLAGGTGVALTAR